MSIKCVEQSRFELKHSGANLSSDHVIFTIKSMIDEFFIEFGHLFEEVKSTGRPKIYSKQELLGCIVYANYIGINSMLKIETLLKDNNEAFNYILNDKKPSNSTLSSFLNENDLLISEFFYYTVSKGNELNLIDGKISSIDGTFIKANANINKKIARENVKNLKEMIGKFKYRRGKTQIQKELEAYFENKETKTPKVTKLIKQYNKHELNLIKKSLKSKNNKNEVLKLLERITISKLPDTDKDINLTDPESRLVKDKKGNPGYNYNLQIATDSKNQFILYVGLNNDANDYNQLIPMIESTIMSLNYTPKYFTADNGYWTKKGLYYCYYNNISLIIPDKNEATKNNNKKSKKKYPKKDFEHDRINNCFICPNGVKLTYKKQKRQNGELYNIFTSEKCKTCPNRKECTKQPTREILEVADPIKMKFKDDYHSDKGQQTYKNRAPTSESIFGVNKEKRNYAGLRRTGLRKCTTDLQIVAIVHNLKIIHKNKNKIKS